MLLPTEKKQPKQRLEDYSILLYGHPKIGKSTFCSQMDSPIFLATEPGLEALSVYEVKVPDWPTFLRACAELKTEAEKPEEERRFKSVIVDTVDNLWKSCAEYVRDKLEIQHESDLGYGKGYAMVRDEFFRAIRKLSLLPYGLVMTSHVNMTEVKTRTATITKAIPTLPKSGRDVVLGMVDIILYAESVETDDGEVRILRTKPSEKWEAGDRTGRLPANLPLDFPTFHEAFHNHHDKGADDQ
ncbi:ATP-binding protein [Paludifilum halophilum]|uniref:ATP-binding protein n=1 Tax=Paludifilum halophilum TaxID=1642702 RepID=A0A235B1B1_9BACL|nr:ATP-binding protein [Paludifilum halophilum]OYD06080.1 hypothetical protein CHM34_18220 [Paludifilum halophilum]